VLSACDLDLAEVRPGDETLGMAAALLSTGTVIASTSRIVDDTAMATIDTIDTIDSIPPAYPRWILFGGSARIARTGSTVLPYLYRCQLVHCP
jgi:hypothetical protein